MFKVKTKKGFWKLIHLAAFIYRKRNKNGRLKFQEMFRLWKQLLLLNKRETTRIQYISKITST